MTQRQIGEKELNEMSLADLKVLIEYAQRLSETSEKNAGKYRTTADFAISEIELRVFVLSEKLSSPFFIN